MSTPRAGPPTADVKLEEKLQMLKASEFGKLKEGARAASQEAASRAERTRKGLVRDWAFQPLTRKATTAQVPGSDPGAPHNVTLVGFNTNPDSEKANTAAPSPAMKKDGLELRFVDMQGGMSVTLGEAVLD